MLSIRDLFLKHSFQRADGVASWYTVCGQPHANYQNWLSGLLVLCGTGGCSSKSVVSGVEFIGAESRFFTIQLRFL